MNFCNIKYCDIADSKLHETVSQIFSSNLESSGQTIPVDFEVKNGFACAIKEKKQFKAQSKPDTDAPEKSEEEKLNFMQIGRNINSNKDNEE